MEVKNLAASLYERRKSKQFDQLRKPFLRDLEALNDLAGYWYSYPSLYDSVARYIYRLRNLYEKKELDDDETSLIWDYHSDVDEACTDIIDRGQMDRELLQEGGTEEPNGT